jgi:hypothetical protein
VAPIELKLDPKLKLRKALASGLPVVVRTGAPGKATVTVSMGGKKLGTATGTVTGTSGEATLKVKFGKAAKKKLLKRKSARFEVSATFLPASGSDARTIRQVVSLRR